MKVTVIIKYSFYRKQLTDKEYSSVVLDEGAMVEELVRTIGVPRYYLRQILVNGAVSDLNAVLCEGDTVVIWPPRIGGG